MKGLRRACEVNDWWSSRIRHYTREQDGMKGRKRMKENERPTQHLQTDSCNETQAAEGKLRTG